MSTRNSIIICILKRSGSIVSPLIALEADNRKAKGTTRTIVNSLRKREITQKRGETVGISRFIHLRKCGVPKKMERKNKEIPRSNPTNNKKIKGNRRNPPISSKIWQHT